MTDDNGQPLSSSIIDYLLNLPAQQVAAILGNIADDRPELKSSIMNILAQKTA